MKLIYLAYWNSFFSIETNLIIFLFYREFDKCFSGGENMSGTSLLVWLDGEVQWFTEILDKQVYNTYT